MLTEYSKFRTLSDNIKLGSLTAFSAGMANVASLMIFFAFTSNVTGHYAILAEEIAKGNWYQAGVVFGWIFLFFFGNFVSNVIIINTKKPFLAHVTPLSIEIFCLFLVGSYGQFFYKETLTETEILVALMLFAMGLQNGLTASVSNFLVKTTHLTGLTTDLGIIFSMFTKRKFRRDKSLRDRAKLLLSIVSAYLCGGVLAGVLYLNIQFIVFYIVCGVLGGIILYDYFKLKAKDESC